MGEHITIESYERSLVVGIAFEYLKTPYHPCAKLKGIGVDCLTLLSCVFEDAGLVENVPLPNYSPQFMMNRSDEQYMSGLLEYTHEIHTPPKPGDIVLWKFGRCFSHSAIVVEWPIVIHAHIGSGTQLEDVSKAVWLSDMKDGSPRPRKFFSYWGG